jgi:hypothetical protein
MFKEKYVFIVVFWVVTLYTNKSHLQQAYKDRPQKYLPSVQRMTENQ